MYLFQECVYFMSHKYSTSCKILIKKLIGFIKCMEAGEQAIICFKSSCFLNFHPQMQINEDALQNKSSFHFSLLQSFVIIFCCIEKRFLCQLGSSRPPFAAINDDEMKLTNIPQDCEIAIREFLEL